MDTTLVSRRPRRALVASIAAVVVLAAALGSVVLVRGAKAKSAASKKDAKKTEAPSAAPVAVSRVHGGSLVTYLESTSSLEPRTAATLVAKRPGQIVQLFVEEGATVRAGQTLAQLEDDDARLALERAQVAEEMARREMERGTQLMQQHLIADRDFDDLQLKHKSALVAVKQARYDLAQTRIVAPFAGRVTDRFVNRGESVVAGKECFKIAEFTPILARVFFPERELANVRVGQTALVSFDDLGGVARSARVELVNPVVDRATGTFKVTLAVDNGDGALRPGSFVRIRLETAHVQNALLLPKKGILTEDGESFVFAARGDSAVRIPIRVGAVSGDTAQVLAGLRDGDRVVTVGQGGLKQGAKIKIVAF